jgi:hypothetical protein
MFRKLLPATYDELPIYQAYHPVVIVFFAMDRCHWCQKALPEVEAAIAEGDGQIPVLQIVLEKNQKKGIQLGTVAKLEGYPTFRRYIRDQYVEYEGPRTKESFLKFFAT